MERRRARGWFERSPRTARARSTVRGVLWLQTLANGLGLTFIALYLRFLLPLPRSSERTELNLVGFGIYLALNVLVAMPINMLLLHRAVRWVREGHSPTSRQRRLVFRLPFLQTLSAFVGWLGAAVLFAVLNTDATRVSVAIALSGLMVCALLYLLLEGHFRPVYALALVDADLPENRRDVFPRLMLAWVVGSAAPLAAFGLGAVIESEPLTPARMGWLSAAAIVAGGVVMATAAVSVSRPIGRVRNALRRVELGDLDVSLPVDDLGELGRLAEGVNHLVVGLAEREQLREEFRRQVGRPELFELADADAGRTGDLPAEMREVTVLFVDLVGYTRYSENRSPQEVVEMLNRFFRVVVAVVNREGGWVNKFEGDAALCLFGAPRNQHDHAARALRAAEDIPRELAREAHVLPPGVGVASGDVIAGFIGTKERFEYTVIGDVVNLAARLCDEAKTQRSRVLATRQTLDRAKATGLDAEQWRSAGSLRIRGRRERAEVATLSAPALVNGRRSFVPFPRRIPQSAQRER